MEADNLVELREEGEPVRDQDDRCSMLLRPSRKMRKGLLLRSRIERREGVIQDHCRAHMIERAGKAEALPLSAGEPLPCLAHKRIGPVRKALHIVFEAGQGKRLPDIGFLAQRDVVADAGIQKLRIVPQGREDARAGRDDRALGRDLSQDGTAESRLAAGDRSGDAHYLAWGDREGHILEERLCPWPAEGEMAHGQTSRCLRRSRSRLLDRPHIGLDPLPGDLRPLDGVEELCGMRGLLGKAAEDGDIHREGRDVPDA